MSIFSIRTHIPGPSPGPRTGAFGPRPAATARPAAEIRPAAAPRPAPDRPERFSATLRRERRERKRDSVLWLLFGVVGATGALAVMAVTAYHFVQPVFTMLDGN